MKKKAINVEYRKDSNTFPDWMKYEITILNEDGTTEKIPAYGKDLQDALSRVVHDFKVEKIEPKVKRVPSIVWAILWFGTLFTMAISITSNMEAIGVWAGTVYVLSAITLTSITLAISNWFKLRNKDK